MRTLNAEMRNRLDAFDMDYLRSSRIFRRERISNEEGRRRIECATNSSGQSRTKMIDMVGTLQVTDNRWSCAVFLQKPPG